MQIDMDDIFEFNIELNIFVEYSSKPPTWRLVICPEQDEDIVYILEDENTSFPKEGFSAMYAGEEILVTYKAFCNYKSIVEKELESVE